MLIVLRMCIGFSGIEVIGYFRERYDFRFDLNGEKKGDDKCIYEIVVFLLQRVFFFKVLFRDRIGNRRKDFLDDCLLMKEI